MWPPLVIISSAPLPYHRHKLVYTCCLIPSIATSFSTHDLKDFFALITPQKLFFTNITNGFLISKSGTHLWVLIFLASKQPMTMLFFTSWNTFFLWLGNSLLSWVSTHLSGPPFSVSSFGFSSSACSSNVGISWGVVYALFLGHHFHSCGFSGPLSVCGWLSSYICRPVTSLSWIFGPYYELWNWNVCVWNCLCYVTLGKLYDICASLSPS